LALPILPDAPRCCALFWNFSGRFLEAVKIRQACFIMNFQAHCFFPIPACPINFNQFACPTSYN
jgi:hypothetical protein